ncbi:MAG: hypothetical protein ACYSWO_06150 [Planctomycetota bacterium]|jgi:hypothetical protein
MKLDYFRQKKELVSTALLVIAVLSAVLILVKVTGFFVASAKAETAVKDAIKHSEPDAKNVTAQLDKSKKVADALKKSNLFSPPPPKQNPIKMVMGIFGDEALINGKWYKAGAKVADAKILAVNPTSVETEWNGKKKTFYPIDAGASGPSGPSRPGRSTSSSSRPGGRPGMVVTQGARPGGGGGGMPGMGGMSRERMMNMSEAERDKFRAAMRERFENMSEAERDKFRQQMRERMGGGRGGPGGGRGGGDGGGRRGGPGGGRGGR